MSVPNLVPTKQLPRPWSTRANYLHPYFTVNQKGLVHQVEFDFHYLFSSERSAEHLREDKNGIFRDIEQAMQSYFHPPGRESMDAVCMQTQPKEEPRTNNGHPRGLLPMFASYQEWSNLFVPDHLLWLQLTFATVEASEGNNSFKSYFGNIDTILTEPAAHVGEDTIVAYSQPTPLINMPAGFDVIANKKTGGMTVLVNLNVVKVLGFNLKGILVCKPNPRYIS
jgi:hypothetical protein